LRILNAALLGIAVALSACSASNDDMPSGPDIARIEAPLTQYGLNGFRQGDSEAVTRARDELAKIAQDESEIGGDRCSREANTVRAAERASSLLKDLDRAGLYDASDEERFVFLEMKVMQPGENSPFCGIYAIENYEKNLPSVENRTAEAPEAFYYRWRKDIAAALGDTQNDRLSQAARKLQSRGLPQSPFRQ
jgi:hypothetical protein